MKFVLSAYNVAISVLDILLRRRNDNSHKEPISKIAKFIDNQNNALAAAREFHKSSPDNHVIWVHASSFGEYQIFRPVIPLLKKRGYYIMLTFFSPTGIDAIGHLAGKTDYPDLILPLPLDTKANANKFLDAINPTAAIFLVSDYWPNFLTHLEDEGFPPYCIRHISKRQILVDASLSV